MASKRSPTSTSSEEDSSSESVETSQIRSLSDGSDDDSSETAEEVRLRRYHLELLKGGSENNELGEVASTPIFTMPVLKHAHSVQNTGEPEPFPQYGLLAGMSHILADDSGETARKDDPRVFFNIAAPSSTFICGSQGSGKSHTLSCLLENCLIPSDANTLPMPLAGLVFHYDTFISDEGGSPCEAAYLASNPHIKVRVLCSPTNFRTIEVSTLMRFRVMTGINIVDNKRTYSRLNVQIEPLKVDESSLNTKRMLDMMAVSVDDGPVPLYLHTIYRILREMRILQQETGGPFNYRSFREQVMDAGLSPAQLGPLNQRLETLESFMPRFQTAMPVPGKKPVKGVVRSGNDWTSKVSLSKPSQGSLFDLLLARTFDNRGSLMPMRHS